MPSGRSINPKEAVYGPKFYQFEVVVCAGTSSGDGSKRFRRSSISSISYSSILSDICIRSESKEHLCPQKQVDGIKEEFGI